MPPSQRVQGGARIDAAERLLRALKEGHRVQHPTSGDLIMRRHF